MKTLGLLKDLDINQSFVFKNKNIPYAVIGKTYDKVQYRRISRSCKNDPKKSFSKYDRIDNKKHYMNKVYEHNGNVEVFDFLPF